MSTTNHTWCVWCECNVICANHETRLVRLRSYGGDVAFSFSAYFSPRRQGRWRRMARLTGTRSVDDLRRTPHSQNTSGSKNGAAEVHFSAMYAVCFWRRWYWHRPNRPIDELLLTQSLRGTYCRIRDILGTSEHTFCWTGLILGLNPTNVLSCRSTRAIYISIASHLSTTTTIPHRV
jgi:hypothetical protein